MESLRLFYCNNWVSIFIILFDCFLKFNYVQKKYRNVEYLVSSELLSLSSIRTVRVMRPLRAIVQVPSKDLIF